MKAYLLDLTCGTCGWNMLKDTLWKDGRALPVTTYCCNRNCIEFEKRYKVPYVSLEPVQETPL